MLFFDFSEFFIFTCAAATATFLKNFELGNWNFLGVDRIRSSFSVKIGSAREKKSTILSDLIRFYRYFGTFIFLLDDSVLENFK